MYRVVVWALVSACGRFGFETIANGRSDGGRDTGNDTGSDSGSDSGIDSGGPLDAISTVGMQTAYIKPSNTGAGDTFGIRVAIAGDGNTLAAGAPGEDSSSPGINGTPNEGATNSGAAYVFVRAGTTWVQQAYVKLSNPSSGVLFGNPVALSFDGSTLVAGARTGSGFVGVFTRNGATWMQQGLFGASNPDIGDEFGAALAVSGDGATLVVGAYGEDSAATAIDGNQLDNSLSSNGAAYVFTRNGNTWSQQAYLKASTSAINAQFGYDVAVSFDGSTVAVGAPQPSTGAGAVFVFRRTGTTWAQEAIINASNAETADLLGNVALSADGSTLVAAATSEDSAATGVGGNQADNGALDSGAAYVFRRTGSTWTQQAYLKPSNTDANDQFGIGGIAMSADGRGVVIATYLEASAATGIGGDQLSNAAPQAGAVYGFGFDGSAWTQRVYVKASNTEANDQFGYDVALSANTQTLVVGARAESSNAIGVDGTQTNNAAVAAGAVYVFE